MKRKFNERAYKQSDNLSKEHTIDFFKNFGYKLVSDLNKEYYKDYDILLQKNEKFYKIECEQRVVFHKIKKYYNTIHIPIRKNHCNFDLYVVWNSDYTEMFMIKKSVIQDCINDNQICFIKCEDENGEYKEQFIDVDKSKASYYYKVDNKWKTKKL